MGKVHQLKKEELHHSECSLFPRRWLLELYGTAPWWCAAEQ